jgi:hypothetical protein
MTLSLVEGEGNDGPGWNNLYGAIEGLQGKGSDTMRSEQLPEGNRRTEDHSTECAAQLLSSYAFAVGLERSEV